MDDNAMDESMKTLDDFARIISNIRFAPWTIIVARKRGDDQCYLQVRDPNGRCNLTGASRPWGGRKWLLSPHMTETEVVKTALKAVLAAVEHEALEKFMYRGLTIFDPHLSIDALYAVRQGCALDARE